MLHSDPCSFFLLLGGDFLFEGGLLRLDGFP